MKEIKEKIIKIIIDNLGVKKAAELSLQGWNFYKLADQILALFPEYAKEIVGEERRKIAKEVMDDIGHNDDCIFCGLKDKKLKELKV